MKSLSKLIIQVLPAIVFAGFSISLMGAKGGPCVEDARKYCAGVSVMGGQLTECLKKHKEELSASCKAQYGGRAESAKSAASAVKESCGQEIQKWCKGANPLSGDLQKCIKDNAKNLSEECRIGMNGLKGSLMP